MLNLLCCLFDLFVLPENVRDNVRDDVRDNVRDNVR